MTRRTTERPTSISGVGLHLGEQCTLTFVPAASGQGISFRRVDLPGKPSIRVALSEVASTERRTHLGDEKATARCIRWSTCWRRWSRSASTTSTIDMDGPEPPILDGSAGAVLPRAAGSRLRSQRGRGRRADAGRAGADHRRRLGLRGVPRGQAELDVTIEFDHPSDRPAERRVRRGRVGVRARAGLGAHLWLRSRSRFAAREGIDKGRVHRQRGGAGRHRAW